MEGGREEGREGGSNSSETEGIFVKEREVEEDEIEGKKGVEEESFPRR